MTLIQTNMDDQGFTGTKNTAIHEGDRCTVAWVDLEEILSDEWEIGGSAMTADEIRALVAGD
jgi:hypothetical protein